VPGITSGDQAYLVAARRRIGNWKPSWPSIAGPHKLLGDVVPP
jgi:hypothetical protein